MSGEPPWKSLVESLYDQGYRSPYLDRLRQRYDVRLPKTTIEQEILEEMAGALRRSEDKVNLALLELELLGKRCDEGPTAEAVEAFNAKRAHALRVRRDLLIHRDALRFKRHPEFEALYPIPRRRHPPEG
jgi:hypothetical protein